jgi:hypothetical protein
MSIQSDWSVFRRSVLVDFVSLTEDDLSLLRHAFFCGASVTYADAMTAAQQGTAAETMILIGHELDMFMAERNNTSIRLH